MSASAKAIVSHSYHMAITIFLRPVVRALSVAIIACASKNSKGR
jgi:hypothetical protein